MPFKFIETPISDLLIVEPRVFGDDRGFFVETYKKSDFEAAGIREDFRQDNHSRSVKGVLRGLHFQRDPYAQGKLVRVTLGTVWDVAVDLRPDSPTLGKYFGLELSAENRRMFYLPPGFAHGFLTLSEAAEFQYKCTEEYHPECDGGLRWDDPDLAIGWPLGEIGEPGLSSKDAVLPSFADWLKTEKAEERL